jgi:hypothetical protein
MKRKKMMFGIKTQTAFLTICFSFSVVTFGLDYDANDFAAEVVSYVEGEGVGYDVISFEFYNQPETALGRPTLETTGDFSIGPGIAMPVVPVYPAWRSFEVVTIGSGGELILRFNHPVGDDENNPYGIDFIVFGNATWQIAGGGSWRPGSDPETVMVGSGFYKERGIVSVSQDGINWYSFSNGPYADDFAPTASYKWDDVNDVWSDELDPTRPVNPNLTITDFDGNSVAEIIDIYDGSAGGTGFDLKDLDPNDYAALAVDANTGQRWIQYVKIEDDPSSFGLPEIDAVADVRCCGDYKTPFPVGDINRDCRVDYEDLEILCDYWLAEINEPNDPAVIADIYEDDIVNFYDWALMADSWLQCNWECE